MGDITGLPCKLANIKNEAILNYSQFIFALRIVFLVVFCFSCFSCSFCFSCFSCSFCKTWNFQRWGAPVAIIHWLLYSIIKIWLKKCKNIHDCCVVRLKNELFHIFLFQVVRNSFLTENFWVVVSKFCNLYFK